MYPQRPIFPVCMNIVRGRKIFERTAQLGEMKTTDASYKVFHRWLAGHLETNRTATEVFYIIKFQSAHNHLKC
jgi:hypothetical protein